MPGRPRSCHPEDYSRQRHRAREEALQYPQIQLNSRNKKAFLIFDIDRRGAESAWEEAGLPAPTTIVMNPTNGHAHLTWMLTTPVFSRPGRFSKPLAFYDRVRSALTEVLGADRGYVGLLTKNPLHLRWLTLWCDRTYTLAELAKALPMQRSAPGHHKHEKKSARPKIIVHGECAIGVGARNQTVFYRARLFAYAIAKRAPNQSALQAAILEFVCTQNERFEKPLTFADLRATAKSIATFAWPLRDRFGVKKEPRSPELTRANRQKGIEIARARRRERLLLRVAAAEKSLESRELPITISSISRMTGISRRIVPGLMTEIGSRIGDLNTYPFISDTHDLSDQVIEYSGAAGR